MKNLNVILHARINLRFLLLDAMQRENEYRYGVDSVMAKSQSQKAFNARRTNLLLYPEHSANKQMALGCSFDPM